MSETKLKVAAGKKLAVKVTPLGTPSFLPGRVSGACAAECTPQSQSAQACYAGDLNTATMSQEDLISLESTMRDSALATNGLMLIGLNATPVAELGGGQLMPLVPPRTEPAPGGGIGLDAAAMTSRGGIYQLMTFPISRLNGVPLPIDSRIRFANPSRWLQGGMESRLFTVSIDGTKKFFSWDAHAPVGKTNHAYYHVNQKGMHSVFGAADHAALTGTAIVQAKQLRYLKLGGRIFLVVGVVVDGIQLGGAAYESYEQKSVKPVAAQAVRTASSWGMAWAGAKAGMAFGGLAGVETGPGMVLTAIGGGIAGGIAGYMGADWIADWIYED